MEPVSVIVQSRQSGADAGQVRASKWGQGRSIVPRCTVPLMRRPRIGKRLTGVSTPFGGASWETVPDVEREVLTRLVTFLEDRRVLYNPSEVEVPRQCVDSVLRLREFLIAVAGQLPRDNAVAIAMRNMAGACRRFLDAASHGDGHRPLGEPMGWGYDSWVFNQALGELRGQIGIYLHGLVGSHDVQVDGPLATILPPPPDSDGDE
jgi:hypothetical protein